MLVSSWTPASTEPSWAQMVGKAGDPEEQIFSWIWFRFDPAKDKLPEVISTICQNFIELGSPPSTKAVDKSHLHQRFRIYAEPSSFGRALIQELCLWNPCGVGGTICREKPTKPPVPMEKWRTEMRVNSSRQSSAGRPRGLQVVLFNCGSDSPSRHSIPQDSPGRAQRWPRAAAAAQGCDPSHPVGRAAAGALKQPAL